MSSTSATAPDYSETVNPESRTPGLRPSENTATGKKTGNVKHRGECSQEPLEHSQSGDKEKRLFVRQEKPHGSMHAVIAGSLLLGLACIALYVFIPSYKLPSLLTSLITWAIIAHLVWRSLEHHQHPVFGQANSVTLLRALSGAILAGFIPIAANIESTGMLWVIAATATVTLCMDGLDGYLARKKGLSSEFGARFDMETDALLALIITLFLWQSDKLGSWVLSLGMMRYAFLVAAIWLAPLQAELYPSLRRKTICVLQVGALCLMLCPLLSSFQATAVGLIALGGLTYSFAIDVVWLFRQHEKNIA